MFQDAFGAYFYNCVPHFLGDLCKVNFDEFAISQVSVEVYV